jgi:hypothetical protein
MIIPDQLSYSEIQPSEQIKLLGVNLNNTLTFITHAQNAASRSLQILGSLSFLRRRSQGISPAISHYLMTTKVDFIHSQPMISPFQSYLAYIEFSLLLIISIR